MSESLGKRQWNPRRKKRRKTAGNWKMRIWRLRILGRRNPGRRRRNKSRTKAPKKIVVRILRWKILTKEKTAQRILPGKIRLKKKRTGKIFPKRRILTERSLRKKIWRCRHI